ncbi:MAG TPA: ABC transporter ATP-binding protein [Rhizomicrobium sp.]
MSMLAAADVTVRRGGRAILDGVSLAARAGEFIAVIGPNGAGKSTLLSLLAGLLKPDAGTVMLDGAPFVMDKALARRRAYLPQNARCEWPLSVERLVALGLTPALPAFGGLPEAFRGKIDKALESCDLAARREQDATTLSGGELMRAMLARAIVGEPQILIVDEPVAGLDPRHALETMRLLAGFARAGTLVIAAMHDLTLAGRSASRIVALKQGRLRGDGPGITATLVQDIFDVNAHVSGDGPNMTVDYPPI